MKIENLKEVLEEIVKRLEEGLHPEQIILFGSYAYGEPTERSDVDLLIVVPDSTELPIVVCKGRIGAWVP
jgi:predicted nucleotidyltransferase